MGYSTAIGCRRLFTASATATMACSASSNKKKRSKVWRFFQQQLNEDGSEQNIAICNLCSKSISRGGLKTANFTTTNLINHINRHHPNEAKVCVCVVMEVLLVQQVFVFSLVG